MAPYYKVVCDGCKIAREFDEVKIPRMQESDDIKLELGEFILRHIYCGPARLVSDESNDPAYYYPDPKCAAAGHEWSYVEKSGGLVWAECMRCDLEIHAMPIAEWDRTHEASWKAQQSAKEQS